MSSMNPRFFSPPSPPMEFLGRGRRYSTQYGVPFGRYVGRPSGGFYFENLTIDPRPGPSSFDSCGFVDSRSVREYPKTTGYFERTGYSRERPPNRHQEPAMSRLPFGRAIRRLFKRVMKGEEFYDDFKSNFDSDIAQIKKYATRDVREKLWLLKTGEMPGDRRDSVSSDEAASDQEQSPERITEQFNSMQRKVTHALEIAIGVRLVETLGNSKRGEIHLNSARRLQQKIEVASDQILDLLQKVTERRENCEALLNELESLKILIDPGNERNKDVYRGVGDDEIEDDEDEEE